jgi:hypothetical protein
MAFAAATLAPLAAWHARNNAVAGYSGFSAIADWNLYFYQGVSILAQQRHQSLETLQAELGCVDNELFFRLHPELLTAGQAAKFRYLHAEGARLVRDNPLVYAKIHLRGLAMLALNPGATDLLKLVGQHVQSSGLSTVRGGPLGSAATMLRNAPTTFLANLALAGTLAIVYGLACIGIWPSLRQPSWQSALVGLLILALFGMAGGPACVARMRHPIMPLVCVFAGLGAVEVRKRFAGRLGNRHGESHRISASNVPARTRQAA